MILSHTLLIAKMAKQGKSIEQVMNALRGRYTLDEVERFWPNDIEALDDKVPDDEVTAEWESLGVLDPDESGLTPAEKGQRTKALNKARAADEASTFE